MSKTYSAEHLAIEVVLAANALNDAIAKAKQKGLHVEIQAITIASSMYPVPRLLAKVEQRHCLAESSE